MLIDWLRALLSGENRMLRLQRTLHMQVGTVLTLLETIKEISMATQDDVNALQATIDQLGGSLTTALTGIQADLDAAIAANPSVDLSALQTSVAALATAVDQATAIDAENPVTPPTV